MLVRSINEPFEPLLRHKRERSSGELDSIDVLPPVAEELIEIRLCDGCVVRPPDLCDALRPA